MKRDLLHVRRILNAIIKAEKYLTGKNLEDLQTDEMLYDALLMELIVLGEETGKISDEFKEKCSHIMWHKIVGMRNRITHEYFLVEAKIIWDTCKYDLPALKKDLEDIR